MAAAGGAQGAPVMGNPYTSFADNQNLQNLIASVQQRRAQRTALMQGGDDIADEYYDVTNLENAILTEYNGAEEMREQKVQVEYLRNDQRLVVPGMLAYDFTGQNRYRIRIYPVLIERYKKVIKLTYAQMKHAMTTDEGNTVPKIRALVAAIELGANEQMERFTAWNDPTWYKPNANSDEVDPPEVASPVFMWWSAALQFNCDIRDVGRLFDDEMTVEDGAWATAHTVVPQRLSCKLKAWTRTCIAAINYPNVNNYAMAAWVRSYALATGCFPARNTASLSETTFSSVMPIKANVDAIQAYEQAHAHDLFVMSMNVVALFGILHLSKDHTYRPNDPNMERIGAVFINSLRTVTNADLIRELSEHKEEILRTAAHPFGLGQTYWVARCMALHGTLAAPLAIRVNASPPPVQRFMVALAAKREWDNLPVGRYLSEVYKSSFARCSAVYDAVHASPPAWSGLHRLYGIEMQAEPTREDWDAVDAIMPIVYGFAWSQHVDETDTKEGIALAMSLSNVRRDRKALSQTWNSLWDGYFRNMDAKGILAFVKEAFAPLEDVSGEG